MRKLFLTTALSLALVSGAAMAGMHGGSGSEGHRVPRMEAAMSQLPKEKADLLKSILEKVRADRKESWEQSKKLHEELKTLLTAKEFDRAAFLAKSKEIDALHDKKRELMTQTIADNAGKFTQEERKLILDSMKRHGKGAHGKVKGADAKGDSNKPVPAGAEGAPRTDSSRAE